MKDKPGFSRKSSTGSQSSTHSTISVSSITSSLYEKMSIHSSSETVDLTKAVKERDKEFITASYVAEDPMSAMDATPQDITRVEHRGMAMRKFFENIHPIALYSFQHHIDKKEGHPTPSERWQLFKPLLQEYLRLTSYKPAELIALYQHMDAYKEFTPELSKYFLDAQKAMLKRAEVYDVHTNITQTYGKLCAALAEDKPYQELQHIIQQRTKKNSEQLQVDLVERGKITLVRKNLASMSTVSNSEEQADKIGMLAKKDQQGILRMKSMIQGVQLSRDQQNILAAILCQENLPSIPLSLWDSRSSVPNCSKAHIEIGLPDSGGGGDIQLTLMSNPTRKNMHDGTEEALGEIVVHMTIPEKVESFDALKCSATFPSGKDFGHPMELDDAQFSKATVPSATVSLPQAQLGKMEQTRPEEQSFMVKRFKQAAQVLGLQKESEIVKNLTNDHSTEAGGLLGSLRKSVKEIGKGNHRT